MIRFLQTNNPALKLVLSAILFIVIITFVVTLIPGILDNANANAGAGILIRVGNQDVSTTEVARVADQLGRRQFPKGYPEMFKPFMMQRAAEQLMTEKALAYQAGRMGMKVGDEELRDELRSGPYRDTFFPGGTFISEEAYKNLLASNGITIQQFEDSLRTELMARKLVELVQASAIVAPGEVEDEYRRENMKVKFDYAVISGEDVLKQIKPGDPELRAFYAKNKDRYANANPEKRKASYVIIDAAKIQAQNTPTQAELQQYYDKHKEQFRTGDSANVRHILISAPRPGAGGKIDQKAWDAARAKADDVRKQLLTGANFDELAKKYSEDPGSAQKGGLYEGVTRGQMVAEFDQATFSLPIGQVSDLVKTSFGYHILRVDSRKAAHLNSLQEVQAQIAPVVAQEKALSQVDSLANKVKDDATREGLDQAAAKSSLNVVSTDLISKFDSLPGVGSSPDFKDALFSAREKAVNLVKTQQGPVIFTVQQIKPPSTPGFDEIRYRVESDFKNDQAQGLLIKKGQELADRAHALHDLKAAAKEVGATVKSSDLVGASSQVPDIGAMTGGAAVAFDLKPGEISGPVAAGQNAAVLQIVQRQEPPPPASASATDQIREAVLGKKRGQVLELFATNLINQLRKEGKIRYNEAEKARLFTPRGPKQG